MYLVLMISMGLLVIAGSALAAYAINVSSERLWLRSKKSEELYYKAEETYLELSNYFRAHYDMSRNVVNQNNARDVAAINRHLVDLKILVGIYFPALGPQLNGCVSAMATAFDMLRLAEAAPAPHLDQAFQSLDYAVSNVRDMFDRFKIAILADGCIDKTGRFWDGLINRGHRARAQRVLSAAA